MSHIGRARTLVLAAPLVLAALGAAETARAGMLQVRDEAHLLTPEQTSHLRAEIASAPFDARFVITTAHPEAQELSRYVAQLVSEADMVVVGVDPEHHHVQVHFGTGSHVPPDAWGTIEKSGNDAFRRGDWEGGAADIFRTAASAASHAPTGTLAPADSPVPAHSGLGTVLLVIGAFAGIALLAAFFLRRRAYGPAGAGYGTAGYGPGYGPGGYGYGPPQGGMGPVGGGLIGAGLGGLAGYELGKMEGEREERGRDLGSGGGGQGSDPGGGDYDAGGGGSDWGGSDGGGGFDGGGGGGGDF